MTSKAERRRKRQTRQGPSAPRVIGANDNIATANDNTAVVVRGVALNKRQAREIDEAEAQLRSSDLETRKAGRDLMAKVNREIDTEVERRVRVASEAEAEAAAAARGDRIARGDDGTLTLSRDGLETLSALRKRADGFPIPPLLTRIQHAAGLRYRHDYEMADPEKKLTPPDPERISSHGGGGEGWAEKQMEIQRRIWTIHLMIAGIEVREGERSAMPALPERHPARRAIHVLNEVAGKGTNLWNLSRSGSVRFRNAEALKVALDACAIVYGLE